MRDRPRRPARRRCAGGERTRRCVLPSGSARLQRLRTHPGGRRPRRCRAAFGRRRTRGSRLLRRRGRDSRGGVRRRREVLLRLVVPPLDAGSLPVADEPAQELALVDSHENVVDRVVHGGIRDELAGRPLRGVELRGDVREVGRELLEVGEEFLREVAVGNELTEEAVPRFEVLREGRDALRGDLQRVDHREELPLSLRIGKERGHEALARGRSLLDGREDPVERSGRRAELVEHLVGRLLVEEAASDEALAMPHTKPLLSRVANAVYWLGRYIERAENVARFLDVNHNLMLDLPQDYADQWQPIV